MQEHINNAEKTAKEFEHLISKHKNSKKKHLDDIIREFETEIKDPKQLLEHDYDTFLEIAFGYIHHNDYESFRKVFQYAQTIFQFHLVDRKIKQEDFEFYAKHFRIIDDNYKIFYDVIRNNKN